MFLSGFCKDPTKVTALVQWRLLGGKVLTLFFSGAPRSRSSLCSDRERPRRATAPLNFLGAPGGAHGLQRFAFFKRGRVAFGCQQPAPGSRGDKGGCDCLILPQVLKLVSQLLTIERIRNHVWICSCGRRLHLRTSRDRAASQLCPESTGGLTCSLPDPRTFLSSGPGWSFKGTGRSSKWVSGVRVQNVSCIADELALTSQSFLQLYRAIINK